MTWVLVVTTTCLTECVKQQAAGAFALGNLLRNSGAAVAAVVIQPVVNKMGVEWCFVGLAIMDLVLVGNAVIGLKKQCPDWRKRAQYKDGRRDESEKDPLSVWKGIQAYEKENEGMKLFMSHILTFFCLVASYHRFWRYLHVHHCVTVILLYKQHPLPLSICFDGYISVDSLVETRSFGRSHLGRQ